MKTRQARLEALERAIPTPPPDVRRPLPADTLVQIRTLWQSGETMRIAGEDYPPETVLRLVLIYLFGGYDPFAVEDTRAAIWPVLTAPDVSDEKLIDLFKRGLAINAEVLASGETGWVWTMRYRWIELFRGVT